MALKKRIKEVAKKNKFKKFTKKEDKLPITGNHDNCKDDDGDHEYR